MVGSSSVGSGRIRISTTAATHSGRQRRRGSVLPCSKSCPLCNVCRSIGRCRLFLMARAPPEGRSRGLGAGRVGLDEGSHASQVETAPKPADGSVIVQPRAATATADNAPTAAVRSKPTRSTPNGFRAPVGSAQEPVAPANRGAEQRQDPGPTRRQGRTGRQVPSLSSGGGEQTFNRLPARLARSCTQPRPRALPHGTPARDRGRSRPTDVRWVRSDGCSEERPDPHPAGGALPTCQRSTGRIR